MGTKALKTDYIQIRASVDDKALIARAAEIRGLNLTDFALQSLRRSAEEAILDQRTFLLDADSFARFVDMLDHPDEPAADVRARYARRPPWE